MRSRIFPRIAAVRSLMMAAGACLAGAGGSAAHAEANPLLQAVGAPEGLTLKAGIRSRIEAIDGQFRPDAAESDFMWSLKTTLFAEYDTGPVRFGAELWDARAYGQKRNSSAGTGEVNAMELIQAYVGLDVKGLGEGSKAALNVGRFALDIGSRRLVARQNFRNTTNAYTGAYFDWQGRAGDRLILLWSMPQIRLPEDADGIRDNEVEWDQETTDLQFFGGTFTKANVLGGTFEIYAYGLNERDSATRLTRNRHLYTPGFRAFRKPAKAVLDYDIEAAYQFGEARGSTSPSDVTDLDVSAYLIHAEVGRTWPQGWQPRLSLHFDLASGDGPGGKSYNRFDTLYGARRWEYGPTGLYGPVGRANLLSGGARIEVKPGKRVDGALMYRALWLADRTDSFASTSVRDRTGHSGRFAGHQLEGRVRYWLVPDLLRMDAGAAWLAKGRFLKDAPSAPAAGDTHYGYLDLALEF